MKSKLMQSARIIPDGTNLVPVAFLPRGTNKLGRWCIAVPENELPLFSNLDPAAPPEANAAICCLSPEGKPVFFEVSMRNFGGWAAPGLFEESEEAFDLPADLPLVDLDGKPTKADHPVKGVIFVDGFGKEVSIDLPPKDGKPQKKALRFNLSNFIAEGGVITPDAKTWTFQVNGQDVIGHLWYVGPENRQRIFGSIAYVVVSPTPPKEIIYGEAVAMLPRLLAAMRPPNPS